MRFTLSSSPAPAKRDDEHAHPREERRDEDDDHDEDLVRDTDGRVRGEADEMSDHDVIDDPLQPADDVREHRRPRELPYGGRRGPSMSERSKGFRGIGVWRGSVSSAATPEVGVAMFVKGGYRASLD